MHHCMTAYEKAQTFLPRAGFQHQFILIWAEALLSVNKSIAVCTSLNATYHLRMAGHAFSASVVTPQERDTSDWQHFPNDICSDGTSLWGDEQDCPMVIGHMPQGLLQTSSPVSLANLLHGLEQNDPGEPHHKLAPLEVGGPDGPEQVIELLVNGVMPGELDVGQLEHSCTGRIRAHVVAE